MGELVVVQREDEIDIYAKGSNLRSNKYLRYRMQRKPNPALNSDVWRWNEVWECERAGLFSFVPLQRICTGGEAELAIRQTGKADFVGGVAHGDEELFSVTCLLDGTELPLGVSYVGSYLCETLEFLQGSTLYEEGTAKANTIAVDYKTHKFTSECFELSHYIVWEGSINLTESYLTMLPFERVNGVQVSDAGFRSPFWAEENITSSGFTQIFTDSGYAKITGPTGYSAEVQIVRGWDKPNREFNFSNAAEYNKLYFDFTGDDYQTSEGEIFDVLSRYRLDTIN